MKPLSFGLQPGTEAKEQLRSSFYRTTYGVIRIMAIDTAKIETVLQSFVAGTSDVQGAALVTPDGLALATCLPVGMDEERTSAMSAAILSLGDRIGRELGRGEVEKIYVEGDRGYCVLTGCGEDAVFLTLATQNAKQGLLMLEIKNTVAELRRVLTEGLSQPVPTARVASFPGR